MSPEIIKVHNTGSINTQYTKQTQENVKHSLSDKTRSAYSVDWAQFTDFCNEIGIDPLGANPSIIADFCTHLATQDLKPATIERKLVSISKAHQVAGVECHTGHLYVRQNLKGIKRDLGTKQSKKAPLLTAHIKPWVEGLDLNKTLAVRDKALILLGFAAALRRSELVALDIEDLDFIGDSILVTIRQSKTDQTGEGRAIAISKGKDIRYCPVNAVRQWIKTSGINSGPLFRGIWKSGKIRDSRLSDKAVNRVVKGIAKTLGLDPADFGGHSLRAGHITQAVENGSPAWKVKAQSGHKSDPVFNGYIRTTSQLKKNSSQDLGL